VLTRSPPFCRRNSSIRGPCGPHRRRLRNAACKTRDSSSDRVVRPGASPAARTGRGRRAAAVRAAPSARPAPAVHTPPRSLPLCIQPVMRPASSIGEDAITGARFGGEVGRGGRCHPARPWASNGSVTVKFPDFRSMPRDRPVMSRSLRRCRSPARTGSVNGRRPSPDGSEAISASRGPSLQTADATPVRIRSQSARAKGSFRKLLNTIPRIPAESRTSSPPQKTSPGSRRRSDRHRRPGRGHLTHCSTGYQIRCQVGIGPHGSRSESPRPRRRPFFSHNGQFPRRPGGPRRKSQRVATQLQRPRIPSRRARIELKFNVPSRLAATRASSSGSAAAAVLGRQHGPDELDFPAPWSPGPHVMDDIIIKSLCLAWQPAETERDPTR
jgi:hypothetical protein